MSFVKSLAWALNIKAIEVDHLEADIMSSMMEDDLLQPPFISLLVSGGHTFLAKIDEFNYELIGKSLDDAAGEVFDKVLKPWA